MIKTNMKTVVFTEDYANKKVGDEMQVDGMLAVTLIQKKVAKIKTEKAAAPKVEKPAVEVIEEEVKPTPKPKKKG